MRIKLNSVMVDNQTRALALYTDVLGFVKKHDIPVGEYRWMTVVSPEGPNDIELSLESRVARTPTSFAPSARCSARRRISSGSTPGWNAHGICSRSASTR